MVPSVPQPNPYLTEQVQGYAIFQLSPTGHIMTWNSGATRLKGYDGTEVCGRHFSMFYTPEEIKADLPALQLGQAKLKGEVETQGWRVRKDGKHFWADIVIASLRSEQGVLLGFTKITRDITLQHIAAHQATFLADAGRLLAHSLDPEATLSALAMLTVPALADCCIIDLKNRDESTRYVKVFHNALNESQLASALDNLPHSKLLRVQRAVQEGRALLEERIAPVKLLQVAEKTQNLTVFDEYPHAMCSIVPLVARGEVLGVLCFVNLTAPLDQDLAEKLAILAAMAVENARLHTAAVAAIQARNHVLSVVAHDLRNPLTAISLLAQQLLRKNTSADLERRVGTAAKTVINCVKVAETLIQNLLDVARIDSDHLYLERKPVRAAALIDDVLRLMTPSAEFKGVTLLGPLSALASMIEVDPERMVQLFSNILGNAIKFTEPDGQITIDAARQGTEVLFSVADTGCGIASDDVPHLFNRFWQARANDRGGAGLGMSIAKGITEAHGGRIWVKSTVGVGTTIFFTAPLCKTLTAAEELGHA